MELDDNDDSGHARQKLSAAEPVSEDLGRTQKSVCDVCLDLDFQAARCWWASRAKFSNTSVRNMRDLKKSSAEGCSKCSFILQAALYFDFASDDNAAIILSTRSSGLVVVNSVELFTTFQIYTPFGE